MVYIYEVQSYINGCQWVLLDANVNGCYCRWMLMMSTDANDRHSICIMKWCLHSNYASERIIYSGILKVMMDMDV